MLIDPQWAELPQLVLTKIYSLLSKQDRFSAASTCSTWRIVLYQPRFFDKITFHVCPDEEEKNAFFLDQVSHFCATIEIQFDSQSEYGAEQLHEILRGIQNNQCIQRLILRPKCGALLQNYRSCIPLIKAILNKRYLALRELDLGGFEYVFEHVPDLLRIIKNGSEQVECLGLATVSWQMENYYQYCSSISPVEFGRFRNLQKLSLDLNVAEEATLELFQGLRSMRTLILHVQDLCYGYTLKGPSNESWERLKEQNPNLRVHLVLIYAHNSAQNLQSLLQPAMPLSHLKVLFCETFNATTIDYLSTYKETLQSLIWTDMTNKPVNYFRGFPQDPLVMLAWQCKKLQELVLNGYAVDRMNVIGIARLRGTALKRFEVSALPWDGALCDEISEQLGRPWTPLPKDRLNALFLNEYYNQFYDPLMNEYVMDCLHESFAEED